MLCRYTAHASLGLSLMAYYNTIPGAYRCQMAQGQETSLAPHGRT